MYAFAIRTLFDGRGRGWLRLRLLAEGGSTSGRGWCWFGLVWFGLVWSGLVWFSLEGRGGAREGRGWYGLGVGMGRGEEVRIRFGCELGWVGTLRLGGGGGMVLWVGSGKGGMCELWLIDEAGSERISAWDFPLQRKTLWIFSSTKVSFCRHGGPNFNAVPKGHRSCLTPYRTP